MGTTFREFLVKRDPHSTESALVNCLIDSGATYSLLPRRVLEELKIYPHDTVSVELADGSRMSRALGGAYFEYNGDGGFAPVLFGEEGEEPLIGVVTLEALRLLLNPYRREVYPQRVVRM